MCIQHGGYSDRDPDSVIYKFIYFDDSLSAFFMGRLVERLRGVFSIEISTYPPLPPPLFGPLLRVNFGNYFRGAPLDHKRNALQISELFYIWIVNLSIGLK